MMHYVIYMMNSERVNDSDLYRITKLPKDDADYSETVQKANLISSEAGEAYESIIRYCRKNFGMAIS
jgi:hypothetical protein